jgi:hypothetical protein
MRPKPNDLTPEERKQFDDMRKTVMDNLPDGALRAADDIFEGRKGTKEHAFFVVGFAHGANWVLRDSML